MNSNSEDDEELAKKLFLAVDPTFAFERQEKQERPSGKAERNRKKNQVPVVSELVEKKEVASPRSKHDDDGPVLPLESQNGNGQKVGEVEEEFPKPYSLDVTPEMQRFIAKKLSKALDKMIDEVMMAEDDSSLEDRSNKKKKESKSGIFLCSSSPSVISARDIRRSEESSTNQPKRKKPQLLRRRRHLEEGNGLDDDDGDDEAKFSSVAVSADWVKSSKY